MGNQNQCLHSAFAYDGSSRYVCLGCDESVHEDVYIKLGGDFNYNLLLKMAHSDLEELTDRQEREINSLKEQINTLMEKKL